MDNKYFNRLEQEFQNNPLQTVFVGSLAMGALSKLISAISEARRTRVYDREVARRERNTYGRPPRR